MKLDEELKKKIDDYFKSTEPLTLEKALELSGFEVEEISEEEKENEEDNCSKI